VYTCPYESDFYQIENWGFPHKFYRCPDGHLPEGAQMLLVLEHLAICVERDFNFELNTGGLNLMITDKFIGWVPYTKHYRDHYNTKLYLEPWNYLGYYTFPELQKQYPETAEIAHSNKFLEFEDPICLRQKVFVDMPKK